MDHVAIMKKSWGLTEKILSGEKKNESRWYNTKRAPWGKIKKGDTVYFKNSGEPVKLKVKVAKIVQFSGLTPGKVLAILNKYHKADGIEQSKVPEFFKRFKNKKYCILVFIKNPVKIKPFDINKKGFGVMSAWLTVSSIAKIKK